MSDDRRDKVFQPSFYTASAVYCVVATAAVLGLGATLAFAPHTRPHLSVFVVLFATGAAATVVRAMLAIYRVERSYARMGDSGAHRLLGCPDAFVSDGRRCVPGTVVLTADAALTGAARAGAPLSHTAPPVAVDLSATRASTSAAFVTRDCGNAAWRRLPWATHKALCPQHV